MVTVFHGLAHSSAREMSLRLTVSGWFSLLEVVRALGAPDARPAQL